MKIKGMQHERQIFRDRRVELDGCAFYHCSFIGCQIVYSGGEVPRFSDCYFDGCTSSLEGPAHNTFDFLKVMISPGSPLRESLLKTTPGLTGIDEVEEDHNAFFRVKKSS